MKELLTKNSKIAKSNVRAFNFGIPAFQSATGLKTCPNAGACAKGCYALAGAYRFSNVAKAFEERLAATQQVDFVPRMIAEIKKKRAERVRIHDSGDFYSQEYLDAWMTIAEACPEVEFYAYTKQIKMFKEYSYIFPKNFTYVFSYGGLQDNLIDRKVDRHSRVFESLEALKAEGYADTSYTDDNAADASIKNIGLVYHGTKSLKNTNWTAVERKLKHE